MATKKTAKKSPSNKVYNLFESRNFTIAFFLAIFALLGGALYLMQSSAYSRSVVLSSNGCLVKATGAAGDKLEYGAYSENKGGAATVAIPRTGTITVASGGTLTTPATTAYAKLKDVRGTVMISKSTPITAKCF